MKRDINKLTAEYEKKFHSTPANRKRFKLYIGDFMQIETLAKNGVEGYDNILLNSIAIALKAGCMIGYKARKAEEREARRKQKGSL